MDAAHILIHPDVGIEEEQLFYQHTGQFPRRYAESFLEAAKDNEAMEISDMIVNLNYVPIHLKLAVLNYAPCEHTTHNFTNGQTAKFSHLGETPLIAASKRGHFHVVKRLLQEGADVTLRAVIDGEEFTAQEIVRRELGKLRLVISSIWNNQFIPTTEQLISSATEYIKKLLVGQNNLEAIMLMLSPGRYMFREAPYSSSLMVTDRFRGFRDVPNNPVCAISLQDLYHGFAQIPLQSDNRSAFTAGRLMEALRAECRRQGRVFRM